MERFSDVLQDGGWRFSSQSGFGAFAVMSWKLQHPVIGGHIVCREAVHATPEVQPKTAINGFAPARRDNRVVVVEVLGPMLSREHVIDAVILQHAELERCLRQSIEITGQVQGCFVPGIDVFQDER